MLFLWAFFLSCSLSPFLLLSSSLFYQSSLSLSLYQVPPLSLLPLTPISWKETGKRETRLKKLERDGRLRNQIPGVTGQQTRGEKNRVRKREWRNNKTKKIRRGKLFNDFHESNEKTELLDQTWDPERKLFPTSHNLQRIVANIFMKNIIHQEFCVFKCLFLSGFKREGEAGVKVREKNLLSHSLHFFLSSVKGNKSSHL